MREHTVLVKWTLDAIREAKRKLLTMSSRGDPTRGPDDYPHDADWKRIVVEALRNRRGDYNEAPKTNGIKTVILTCTATIITAGIIGGIVLSNEFAALRAQVTEWQKATDRRLEALERRP